jgi:hypothetical protein
VASRSDKRRRPAPRGVDTTPPGSNHAGSSALYANIEAVLRDGGQILIGTVHPIRGAAVAHDGHKTLAMLRTRPQEPLFDLLLRLDTAIATAKSSGQRVDEINTDSSKRYEL